MDPRFLRYYEYELQHLRRVGEEFANEYPEVAGRLGLEAFECKDPYVERLLEGFAFLAARVQLKLDAQFPRFTQHLLEMVFPHYLAPTPSMGIVQFQPDFNDQSLAKGITLSRELPLHTPLRKGDKTPCEYRTAHTVTLWPLNVVDAHYLVGLGGLDIPQIPEEKSAKSGIRLRLRATAGLTFDKLPLKSLSFYLAGSDNVAVRLYEQFLSHATAIAVYASQHSRFLGVIKKADIRAQGFEDGEALLPFGPQSFSGYRLLHEYFALSDRFLFVEIGGLESATLRCEESELDLIVLLDRPDSLLENAVDASRFALFCSPVINLFPRTADRIPLKENRTEYHIVPDRARPMDFEVYDVTKVVGHGSGKIRKQEFLPFYAFNNFTHLGDRKAYYTLHREPRVMSSKQRSDSRKTHYLGSEIFISLVDGSEGPYHSDLRELELNTRCTNRDLPLEMLVGRGRAILSTRSGETVQFLAGPTRPRIVFPDSELGWRLISHLSLNYLSITDSDKVDEHESTPALCELLTLYSDIGEASIRKQIEGIKSVVSRPVVDSVNSAGIRTFVRGLEVTLDCDESAFEGTGVFLLGAVLNQFFSRYVSMNSFTETVLKTNQRGEVKRWPAEIGRCPLL